MYVHAQIVSYNVRIIILYFFANIVSLTVNSQLKIARLPQIRSLKRVPVVMNISENREHPSCYFPRS